MTTPLGDSRINLLQQALSGLARRQQAIAGNIANVDTPGYQRQDVNFEAGLRASLGQGGMQLAATDPHHLSGVSSGDSLLQSALGTSQGSDHTGRNDGNNVDVDYEMTQMAETQLKYEMLTEATSNRFSMLTSLVSKVQ